MLRSPSLVRRDAPDDVTARASRVETPLTLDGRARRSRSTARVAPLTDFIQQEPRQGRAGDREDRGVDSLRRRPTSTSRPATGTASRGGKSPTRCAATTATSSATTTSPSSSTPSSTSATATCSRPTRSGALRDMTVTDDQQNSAWNGIWYVKTGPLRPGLDARSGHPLQDAALQRQRGADLGRQHAAAGALEERVLLSVAGAGRARHAGRERGWRRRPEVEGIETPAESKNLEFKPYALGQGDLGAAPRAARSTMTSDAQRRPRLQVRADPQPDPRCHLAHRLRAGGRRPATGEPHALQPVLSGETRLLHRGAGHLRLRRRAGRQQPRRRAAACSTAAVSASARDGRCRWSAARASPGRQGRLQHRLPRHPHGGDCRRGRRRRPPRSRRCA